MAYRISDRFAIGLRYDDDLLNWNKTSFGGLTFGDMIDPRRGFIYSPFDAQDRYRTLAGTVAYKVHGGFSVGASMENNDVSGANIPLSYFSFGVRQRLTFHAGSGWKHGIIGSLSCTNASSASETRSISGRLRTAFRIARAGASYSVGSEGMARGYLTLMRYGTPGDNDLTAADGHPLRW